MNPYTPTVMRRPPLASRGSVPFALLVSAIALSLMAGVSYAGSGWGFQACEIAHPDTCTIVGLNSLAFCRDMLGTFGCHHNVACHAGSLACACNGKGIAELEGLSIPADCTFYGLKQPAWYHFQDGVLSKPMSFRKCIRESPNCFGMGFPNYEQGFKRQ